jgi:perosamine synthetase
MLGPHPTFRFGDVFPPRAQSLSSLHGPQRLHLTYNARAAFYQLLLSLANEGRRKILLPAFHCTALVEPVARSGYSAEFYRIRRDFSVDVDDIRQKATSDVAALVVIHYFGFPTEMTSVMEIAGERGIYVVEDCAHSFLSRQNGKYVGHCADFALFSYHKFAPSLAGGALAINRKDFVAPAHRTAVPFRERLVIIKRLLEQAITNRTDGAVRKLFSRLESARVALKRSTGTATSPSDFVDDPYFFREDLALASMPWVCRRIIESCNWQEIASTRQKNYRLLSTLIRDSRLLMRVFPVLPDEVCPWAFPILLNYRLVHEQKLRALGVPLFTFGELLHPLLAKAPQILRQEAEFLSDRLLMLPIHPQLTEQELSSMANTLNGFVAEREANEMLSDAGCCIRSSAALVREGEVE